MPRKCSCVIWERGMILSGWNGTILPKKSCGKQRRFKIRWRTIKQRTYTFAPAHAKNQRSWRKGSVFENICRIPHDFAQLAPGRWSKVGSESGAQKRDNGSASNASRSLVLIVGGFSYSSRENVGETQFYFWKMCAWVSVGLFSLTQPLQGFCNITFKNS